VRLVVSGGGTGGHIYPAISVAKYVTEHQPDASVTFIGSSEGPEAAAARDAGIPFEGLDVEGVAGRGFARALRASLKFLAASLRCRRMLKQLDADCVLGTGGYASAPACLAALTLRKPLVLHEMNYEPGLVTKLFSRCARAIALAYEDTVPLLPKRARKVVTGVPVRPDIEAIADAAQRERARNEAVELFGLEKERRTLLVFGGSQGAEALNAAVWSALPALAGNEGLQLLHLTGRKNFDLAEREDAENSLAGGALIYRPVDYLERMDRAYAVADIALSRAGAGTIAELMAVGLPAVLVPFPYAGGHQEKNARALEASGAVKVVTQAGGSADAGMAEAIRVIEEGPTLEKMKGAAGAVARPGGAKGIAQLLEELR